MSGTSTHSGSLSDSSVEDGVLVMGGFHPALEAVGRAVCEDGGGASLRFVLLDADLEAAAAASSRRRTTLELPEGHDPDGRSAASVLEDWAAKRLRRLVRGLAQGCVAYDSMVRMAVLVGP